MTSAVITTTTEQAATIIAGLESEIGNQADREAVSDIGFHEVRIARLEREMYLCAGARKHFTQVGFISLRQNVRGDWKRRDLRQRRL